MLSSRSKAPLADLALDLWASLLFWVGVLPTVYLWALADDLFPQDVKKILRDAGMPAWNVEFTDDIYITLAVKKKDELRARRVLERNYIVIG